MKELFPYILKIIEFIRPRFYNKITWLVVISGLSIMSTPLWLALINALLKKELNFSFSGENDLFWGFLLCITGLIYHIISTVLHELALVVTSREKRARTLAHDTIIFERLNNQLQEEFLEKVIAHLETSDAIYWDDFSTIERFSQLATQAGNSFVSPELKEKTEVLIKATTDLRLHVQKDFDEYPYGQCVTNFRMCLAPQLNCDRAGNWEDNPKYDALTEKMMAITAKLNSEYRAWRLMAKEVLYL